MHWLWCEVKVKIKKNVNIAKNNIDNENEMNKIFLNIKCKDFKVAFDNIDTMYKCGKSCVANHDEDYYIRIYSYGTERIGYGYGTMSIYDYDSFNINGSTNMEKIISSNYVHVDYYEWYKENETIITAIKFGLY